MKRRELLKPRKVVNVMTAFLNEASDMIYTESILNGPKPNTDDIDDLLKWMLDTTDYEVKRVAKMRKYNKVNFAAFVGEEAEEHFTIYYNFETLYNNNDGFRAEFIERCPLARGFADITLTLLHELGHFETFDDTSDNFDRAESLKEIREKTKNFFNIQDDEAYDIFCKNNKSIATRVLNHFYHEMEDEWLATQWAIDWLNNSDNRKIAKAFEKEFFKCFAK